MSKNINKISIIISLGIILVLVISTIEYTKIANGFLFWNDKPSKPQLGMITNPILIEEFDKLYAKYPNINQIDIDNMYQTTTIKCQVESAKNTPEESRNSPFSLMIQQNICSVILISALENYLTQLNIPFYSNGGEKVPTLESTLYNK